MTIRITITRWRLKPLAAAVLSAILLYTAMPSQVAIAQQAADVQVKSDTTAAGATSPANVPAHIQAAPQGKDVAAHANLPHDLSPLRMFLAADIVVQAVMASLLLASVIAWSIWLAKILELASTHRQLKAGVSFAGSARTLDARGVASLPESNWISRCLQAAREEIEWSAGTPAHGIKERVASRMAEIERAAVRSMRTGTGILASIGSTAPFVGLFGTVWGVMNSFIGISRAQTTNLAVVAPGIAEALLATAIGLVAAIPAVLFYNHLTRAAAANKALLGDGIARVERLVSRELDETKSVSLRSSLKLAAE